jgi:Tfp pilus assembly protein PilW
MKACFHRYPLAHKGFSLIELLVAMAMSMGLVLVILTVYQNLNTGSAIGQSQQRMNEDAYQAFQILGQQFQQAAYNPIQPRTETPRANLLQLAVFPAGETAMGIFSCKKGFSNGAGSTPAANIGDLACNSSAGSDNHAFAVQFEADANSPSASGGIPSDCRSFTVPARIQTLSPSNNTVTYRVVENRFFIAAGGLSCTGNGSSGTSTTAFETPSQPLVGNIESMEISFGVTAPNAGTTAAAKVVAGYLDASQIGPAFGSNTSGVHASLSATTLTASARWELVKTARVCLTVKSEKPAFFEPIKYVSGVEVYGYYYGCNPNETNIITISDRYPRRSYVQHFALRNRIATP